MFDLKGTRIRLGMTLNQTFLWRSQAWSALVSTSPFRYESSVNIFNCRVRRVKVTSHARHYVSDPEPRLLPGERSTTEHRNPRNAKRWQPSASHIRLLHWPGECVSPDGFEKYLQHSNGPFLFRVCASQRDGTYCLPPQEVGPSRLSSEDTSRFSRLVGFVGNWQSY